MSRCNCYSVAALAALTLLSLPSRSDAALRKIFAVSHQQPAGLAEVPGNPSDSIMFYDVTAIGTPGATNVFNNSPLFTVWLGYEIFQGEVEDVPNNRPRGNREDTSALTFNPANGTVYAIAFDSGSPGTVALPNNPDPVGDNQGDFDLYRVDYQEILKDFVDNSRPMGTIYAPQSQRISTADETFLQEIASPLFDGTVDGIAHNVPHPAAVGSTVFMPNAIDKIGEIGRSQGGGSFFDTEFSFIDPETFALLDNASAANPGAQASDFQIRSVQRVSTAPGAATLDFNGADDAVGPPGSPANNDDQQGGRNGNSTQSWESYTIGRLEMDAVDHTEPGGWTVVKSGGKIGLWVADNEGAGGGDEVAYFELDFSGATATATKKTLPTTSTTGNSFRIDENPATDATTSNGEIDFLFVNKDGDLVGGESGFFDTVAGSMTPPTGSGGLTAQEPRVLTVGVESYATGPVPEGFAASGGTATFDSASAWDESASIPVSGANDNDTEVTNTTKVAYDKSTGWVFIIDQDVFGTPSQFLEDLYVFDPVSGQIIYHELRPFDIGLFNTGTQIVFTRGDINGDGMVSQADVTTLQAGIADPTLGGTVSAAVGAEWYDLTGDGILNNADLAELTSLIGAAPIAGDFDNDGDVDGADLADWRTQFGPSAGADADGDGDSDGNDFLVWQRNLGAGATAAAAAIPEPAAAGLLAIAAFGFAAVRRRD